MTLLTVLPRLRSNNLKGLSATLTFDKVIEELNKFESIRYPDALLAKGATMMFDVIRWDGAESALSQSGSTSQPHYRLCLEEIDELVGEIFRIASRNPEAYLRTMLMKKDAQNYLRRDNTVFK
jgi:hypothetical protein